MTTFNNTVVACIVCSNTVLVSNSNYTTIITGISNNTMSDVLFRCTVCTKCDRKTANQAPASVDSLVRGSKLPIGVSIILNWTVYKNVSLFLHKYCKLYSYNSKQHVVENRLDIIESIKDDIYIHQFFYDDKLHLESGDMNTFFIDL